MSTVIFLLCSTTSKCKCNRTRLLLLFEPQIACTVEISTIPRSPDWPLQMRYDQATQRRSKSLLQNRRASRAQSPQESPSLPSSASSAPTREHKQIPSVQGVDPVPRYSVRLVLRPARNASIVRLPRPYEPPLAVAGDRATGRGRRASPLQGRPPGHAG
jgi:hypothetical protein